MRSAAASSQLTWIPAGPEATELGVSRAPVREALIQLARELVLDADLGYGFEVRGLFADEVEQTYPILWTLEGLALRSAPPLTKARYGTANGR